MTGTNLAGGDLYRCKFGDTVVSAHFDDYTSTIGCVAPKRDGGGESVKFSVAIFFYAADKTHHVASHARLFRYYGAHLRCGGLAAARGLTPPPPAARSQTRWPKRLACSPSLRPRAPSRAELL